MCGFRERGVPNDVALLVKRVSDTITANVYFAVKRCEVGLDFGYVCFPDYVGGVWGGSSAEPGLCGVALELGPLVFVEFGVGC